MSNMNDIRKSYATPFSDNKRKAANVSLLVDGSILNIILSNDYLKSHF